MEQVSKETILGKTHYGTNIYAHVLRLYYPNETVLKLVGRDCVLCRNPFNDNKQTLHVWIEKENVLHTVFDKEHARHEDTQNAIPAGDAFNFAELHYHQQGYELLQTLNKEMNLHIGEKRDFYNRRNVEPPLRAAQKEETPPALFSFFRAPISNTKPHKSISLLDAYNYIVGDYAKERTKKLRAMHSPLSCGEGSGERSKQVRTFKAANFDYCTFSGIFTSRSDKALIQHSGFLCIDFDHLKDVSTLFNRLLNDEYFDTQLLFRSPSGDGLKWIIQISPPLGDLEGFTHGNYFAAVANYIQQTYGVAVDKSGRDISRACFLPHDPQAFINPIYLK